jgi:hypothetical protein
MWVIEKVIVFSKISLMETCSMNIEIVVEKYLDPFYKGQIGE